MTIVGAQVALILLLVWPQVLRQLLLLLLLAEGQ